MNNKTVSEWQFDGLVGPTHNYAGLAIGNLASTRNAGAVSNPRQAALQGIDKMRFILSLGVNQAILPPLLRPNVPAMKQLAFRGALSEIIAQVGTQAPELLSPLFSASAMWTANAATVTPSIDVVQDQPTLHFTPANLATHFHRALEAQERTRQLQKIFHNKSHFTVHNPLFMHPFLGDEGAANHMISSLEHGQPGHHYFVYGENQVNGVGRHEFPSRQQRLASQAIARRHGIAPEKCLFLEQSQEAIAAGVFHHDVIGMNTAARMILHEQAFTAASRSALKEHLRLQPWLNFRQISSSELSLTQAVSSYLFNSQYLLLADGRYVLIAPAESEEMPSARQLLQRLQDEGLLDALHFLNLRESMRNGGGPACLRLRVQLNTAQSAAMHSGIVMDHQMLDQLTNYVLKYYRDRLHPDDFLDPDFHRELMIAHEALENLLSLPGLYTELL